MRFCIQWLLGLPLFRNTVSFVTVNSVYDVPFTLGQFNHACATPITTLLLDTERLLTHKKADLDALQRIALAAHRLKKITSCTHVNFRETCDVSEVIQEAITFLGVSSCCSFKREKKYTFTIKGSEVLFSEVIMCLINNAVEAYPDNQVKKEITISTYFENENVVVTISDHGCGMNVFELWCARMDGVSCHKKSTGIGLPFCIKTVRNYFNGSVRIASSKGSGTTVKIAIPRC